VKDIGKLNVIIIYRDSHQRSLLLDLLNCLETNSGNPTIRRYADSIVYEDNLVRVRAIKAGLGARGYRADYVINLTKTENPLYHIDVVKPMLAGLGFVRKLQEARKQEEQPNIKIETNITVNKDYSKELAQKIVNQIIKDLDKR
jgi:hypothetical protein